MRRIAAFGWHPRVAQYVMRPDHPLKPYRYRLVYETLQRIGAFTRPNARVLDGRLASDEELALVHSTEYVRRVKLFSEDPPALRPEEWGDRITWSDTPPWPNMHDDSATVVGTSLVCLEAVTSGTADVAFNGSGGLHHAMRDRASGFCVYNDPAIVVAQLVRGGKRVAYVDIDAHHGDGVQAAFYDDDRALTISLHEFAPWFFPGTGRPQERGTGRGAGYSVNVALMPETDDDAYAIAFDTVVPPLVRAFAPDVLVTQGGFDTYFECPIAQLALSTHGYERCYRAFASLGLPWIALGGGGYDVDAVRRAWSIAYLVMLDAEIPAELHDADPPRAQGRDRGVLDEAARRSADAALAASFAA
ncbi:MAG TPA: acetoin utilization protein AcuC [Candidatus Dormibacteraeota bacterium]|nr:acetoin utilization protein AcuC [Candidatus Dormibacteraeota bacterium]